MRGILNIMIIESLLFGVCIVALLVELSFLFLLLVHEFDKVDYYGN